MTAPTPASVPSAHVVKVRSRGQTWTTAAMSPALAEHCAGDLVRRVELLGGGQGFVDFVCADGRHVDVRARDIYAIEHGPVIPPSNDISGVRFVNVGGDQ